MEHVPNWHTRKLNLPASQRHAPLLPTSCAPGLLNVAITLRPGARDRAKVVIFVLQQPLSCVECALILAVNSRSPPYTVFIITTKTVSHSRVDYCFAARWEDGSRIVCSMGFSYVEGDASLFPEVSLHGW